MDDYKSYKRIKIIPTTNIKIEVQLTYIFFPNSYNRIWQIYTTHYWIRK